MEINVNIQSYRHIGKKEKFFDNIGFNIDSNGIYFLIGSSGIGKTTLLNIMLGLNEGDFDGKIIFKKDNKEYSPVVKRKTGLNVKEQGLIGYASQDSTLIPWINVEKNLLLPSKINKNLSVPSREDIVQILTALNFDASNVEDILQQYSDKLSFGMKARIGLARVLLYNPSFLILDELFTGTDSYTNECICKHLKEKENDMIIFCVSHNEEMAFEIAKKISVLNNSKKRQLDSFLKTDFDTKEKQLELNIKQLLKN